jgi:hypothetical protein
MTEYKINIFVDATANNFYEFPFDIMERGAYQVYVNFSGGRGDMGDANESNPLLNTDIFNSVLDNYTSPTSTTTYPFSIPLQCASPTLSDNRYVSFLYREPNPIYINSPPLNNTFNINMTSVFQKTTTIATIKGFLSLRFVKI